MKFDFNQNDFDKMRNNPENYKWGIFYYSPRDPRLLVPRKFGFGWSLNFAHPMAFVILFGILTIVLFTSILNSLYK